MILGACLQVASSPSESPSQTTKQSSVDFNRLMLRAVEAARNLVNSKDEMVGSLEGIECIAMEAMYYVYTGDLHRGWLTMRRAILIAQTMGLHRGIRPTSVGSMGDDQSSPDSGQLWFNLIHLDRYLSLMTGLPQCSSDSPFATPAELQACEPEEKLRRLDCLSAGRILEHGQNKVHDYEIFKIDKLLQEAAACMPSRWWLHSDRPGDEADYYAVLKDHVRHYHLLAQLHWPSLLAGGNDSKDEYGKLITVNASRKVLSCYIALANTWSTVHHSPCLNRICFTASTALFLAYLNFNKYGHSSAYAASFIHQRHSDRGMMEQAFEIMERGKCLSYDTTSDKIKGILQQVLIIDASASRGINYNFRVLAGEYHNGQFGGEAAGDRGDLRINIPPYDPILIERCNDASDFESTASTLLSNGNQRNQSLIVDTAAESLFSSCEYAMPDGASFVPDLDIQEWVL
jgi:hypothetical protein